MPQFDVFSFYNQVTFFLLFFFLIYFSYTYYILPSIITGMKFRKKRENLILQVAKYFSGEVRLNRDLIQSSYNKIFSNFSNIF